MKPTTNFCVLFCGFCEIMEDSHNFGGGGGAAKGAHAVLLCKMEEGRIDWADTHKIDRVRRAYAHKVQMYRVQSVMWAKMVLHLANSFKKQLVHTKLIMKRITIPTFMCVVSVSLMTISTHIC